LDKHFQPRLFFEVMVEALPSGATSVPQPKGRLLSLFAKTRICSFFQERPLQLIDGEEKKFS